MIFLQRLKTFIQELDARTFYTYLLAFIGTVVLLMSGVLYFQYRSIKNLKKRMARVNNSRQTVQEILTNFEKVKQQKMDVDELLDKEKNFKIIGYIDQVITKLELTENKAGNIQQSEDFLVHLPKYSEIKIVVPFINLDMRQLAELLHEIEKNERIYTKELEITQSPTKPVIDVILTIATLQPRTAGELE